MKPIIWKIRDRTLTIHHRPLVMGIVNVTPDSFSDGGRWFDHRTAVAHALQLVEQGADILDIGGESTRPGATPVPLEEELRRVVPVVQAITQRTSIPLSIDTMKAEVARQCLAAGASIINDVSGFRDPMMVAVAQSFQAGCIVMHMPGDPQTMMQYAHYTDVVEEVANYLEDRLQMLQQAGIAGEAICVDPGIGFGKNLDHSLTLLAHLERIAQLKRPVCLGVSRKGFLGQICQRPRDERDPASLAVACIAAARRTAHILRVHEVCGTRDAARLLEAIDQHRRTSPDGDRSN
ncbi:MAG: dihydropteroate synthase [Gemmataceae bacterium]|nr:dihydropteroate synthase [Gemmata sp.]MDW8196660.1 dihydropteroate synthase [Gemmataceae bacterium]